MSSSHPLRMILKHACVCYTVTALVLCTVLLLIFGGSSGTISPLSFLLIFPFSVCYAVAAFLYKKTALPLAAKVILHFLFTVGGFFFFVFLPARSANRESGSVAILITFIIGYLIIFGLTALFTRRWKKETDCEEDYTPQFSTKNKE